MSKIKRWLAAAAVLIASGLGVNQALRQAAVDEGLSKDEVLEVFAEQNDRVTHWYLAVRSDAINSVPEAFTTTGGEGRIIGTRGDQLPGCGDSDPLTPCGANDEFFIGRFRTWGDVGGPVSVGGNSWFVAQLWGHPYFAGSWQRYAIEQGGETGGPVRFFGTLKEFAVECMRSLTGAQCRNLFEAVNPCGRTAGGVLCRHGLEAGKDSACPSNIVDPLPCVMPFLAGVTPEDIATADRPDLASE